jgi:hypothetical protein
MELTRDKYGNYHIDGRRTHMSFVWHVRAKVYRRRSKRTRLQDFEVTAQTRNMADYALRKHFKGATVTEVVSLVPVNFWPNSFWWDVDVTQAEKFPRIEPEILNQLELPTDL